VAVDGPNAFEWGKAELAYRGNLPHVRQENAIYFVTFRLGDSLPPERVAELKKRRAEWLSVNPPPHSAAQEQEYRTIWTARLENMLDAGYGCCMLRESECRGFVEATMRHDDSKRYGLGEFVIMPNHVHALVHVYEGEKPGLIIGAWKSVSARRIGKKVQERGSLWMEEYFDHLVRSDESMERFVNYIRANPKHLQPSEFTTGCGTLSI
jgi:REP element-mobilizing transposase RayT